MRLRTFKGEALHKVVMEVRREMGDDAMVVRTRNFRQNGKPAVEVVAAMADEVEVLKRRLDGGRAAARRAQERERVGPYVIALVGPAGAGKTTSLIKLALHPRGVGRRKVGLITLDTHRVAGIEEIQTFAEITNLHMEVVYDAGEVAAAVKRMRGCDVILVDCPGRTPNVDAPAQWELALAELKADEVHLVLPAGLRHDVATATRRAFAPCDISHVLYTQLDTLVDDAGLAELAEHIAMPTRWVADGHEIPADLKEAAPRILAALGLATEQDELQKVG